jgi:D-sedoheptulose 7-phosphate isomerase
MEHAKNYLESLKATIDKISTRDVDKVIQLLYDAYLENRQIFLVGNGGSASTASHFACDLSKGTLQRVYDDTEKRFRIISLTDNVAILTAIGNDLSYDDIFSQQLKNLVNKGDILIAITGSGNSPNIINAVKTASNAGAVTIGFLGFDGGKVMGMLDHVIHIPSDHYGQIEDLHMVLAHMISSGLTRLKKHEN